jgi:hypothetical protein
VQTAAVPARRPGPPTPVTRCGPGRDRWLRHACDGAVRLAVVAAALCPALSSLGGALVGLVLRATMAAVARAAADEEGA